MDKISRLRPKQRVDIRRDVRVFEFGRVPLHHLAVFPDEKLFKIPRHITSSHRGPLNRIRVRLNVINVVASQTALVVARRRRALLQKRPKRVLLRPVHRHLRRQRKLWLETIPRSDVFERREELEILLRTLMAELIARRRDDDQRVAVLFFKGVQLNKVPYRRPSETRYVIHQHHFPSERVEIDRGAVRRLLARAAAERGQGKLVRARGGSRAHRALRAPDVARDRARARQISRVRRAHGVHDERTRARE